MAAHYDLAVIPARVRKPKDKAKVEAAVGLATRWILAVLRNRTFFSLTEARTAVRQLLDQLNDRQFKMIPGSRRSVFEALDKPALKPLPVVHFEYAEFKNASVHIDYHIQFDSHFYSVPHQFRGEVVEVRSTQSTVEVFRRGKRIASHPRALPNYQASTINEHRPKNHQQYGDWSPERITSWAKKIGPSTLALVERIVSQRKLPEHSFRTCLGILRLEKKFGNDRLESACHRALAIHALSFKSVKSILDSNLDSRPLSEKPHQLSIVHANIRGASAYAKTTQENTNVDTPNDRLDEDIEAFRDGTSAGNAAGHQGGS